MNRLLLALMLASGMVMVSSPAIAFDVAGARQGRGVDDPIGHIRGGHGADDLLGHISGGNRGALGMLGR